MRKKIRRKPRVHLRSKLRKERTRRIGILAAIIIAVTILTTTALIIKNTLYNFLHSDIFIVKKISIKGLALLDETKVSSFLNSVLLTRQIPIWKANYKKIKSITYEKFPRIKTLKFYPTSTNSLAIKITERKPIALVESVGGNNPINEYKIFAIDSEGVIFPPANENEISQLPTIKNYKTLSDENINRILSFIINASQHTTFFKKIKSISLDNFILRLETDEDYSILWSDISEITDNTLNTTLFHEKISSLENILKKLAATKKGKIKYIDLTTITTTQSSKVKTKRAVVYCITPT